MKQRMTDLLNAEKSSTDLAGAVRKDFGLSVDKHYDALVVAPGWRPTKIMVGFDVEIICTAEHSYISGYEVKGDGFLIAWVQIGAGAHAVIDELSICSILDFDKLIFIGAVGALVPELPVGTVCTPSWSVAGNLANGYLSEDITKYTPFGMVYPNDTAFVESIIGMASDLGHEVKTAPVFCTDSIFGEYAHMDFIKTFGVSLIEMETSTFYLMADLLEKPAIALLAVSDNLATGDPLIVRSEEQVRRYDIGRKQVIPELIMQIAKM